jgi:transposase
MMPIKTFVSERRAANLLSQIRWRDGVYCPLRLEGLVEIDEFYVKVGPKGHARTWNVH